MKQPYFSIVIPTYNRVKDLQFALYCILRQSFSDYEIIVSDNCSVDTTKKIVRGIRNKKIRYYRNNKNIGSTRNYGEAITLARGKYIFMHGDDDFLLYDHSLQEIYNEMQQHKEIGYVRVNYMCTVLGRKRVFNFAVNRPFHTNEYLPPSMTYESILSFILRSDAYFLTGIIFKNCVPRSIQIIDSQHAPWIEMLLFVTKKYGAEYINKQHVVASWSEDASKKNTYYSQYSLIQGKLEAENYFDHVRTYLDKESYERFLYQQLQSVYVRFFPLIKYYVGTNNFRCISRRIREICPAIARHIDYWVWYAIALVIPVSVWGSLRRIYLFLYMRMLKVDHAHEVMRRIRELENDIISFYQPR